MARKASWHLSINGTVDSWRLYMERGGPSVLLMRRDNGQWYLGINSEPYTLASTLTLEEAKLEAAKTVAGILHAQMTAVNRLVRRQRKLTQAAAALELDLTPVVTATADNR